MKQKRLLLGNNRSEKIYHIRFLLGGLLLVLIFFYSSYYIYLHPVFDKPPIAENQVEGMPQRNTQRSFQKYMVDDTYKFYLETQPSVDGDKLYLYLTNMYYNEVYLCVQVFTADGKKLGQSDLCSPGHYIESVDISGLKKGESITMKVISYEVDTYYSRGNINIQTEIAL